MPVVYFVDRLAMGNPFYANRGEITVKLEPAGAIVASQETVQQMFINYTLD